MRTWDDTGRQTKVRNEEEADFIRKQITQLGFLRHRLTRAGIACGTVCAVNWALHGRVTWVCIYCIVKTHLTIRTGAFL